MPLNISELLSNNDFYITINETCHVVFISSITHHCDSAEIIQRYVQHFSRWCFQKPRAVNATTSWRLWHIIWNQTFAFGQDNFVSRMLATISIRYNDWKERDDMDVVIIKSFVLTEIDVDNYIEILQFIIWFKGVRLIDTLFIWDLMSVAVKFKCDYLPWPMVL